ncbi:MAG: hypothetical protein ABI602_01340 [Candidatus Saccharibacteria bacterium]
MSGRDYERQPLADDIFGSPALMPEVGYIEATPASEPVVPYPQYAPANNQPLDGGEPKLFATLAGHADKPIYVYPDGRKVVRVPRSAPVNDAPRAVVETSHPTPLAPLNSLSLNLRLGEDGGLSGEFDVKGQFMHFLGGSAGATATNNKSIAPGCQLESSTVPTQHTPERVVAPMPLRSIEAPHSEYDNDGSSHETATIASHGLKKVIKAVLRPRLTGAVLALSVAVAGGTYRLESGELPIHGNPITVIQADYNQVIHHPLQTIAAKIGKL